MMWAVSALALLVNPVLGVAMLLSAAITTNIKAFKVDSEAVKRGDLPPSARLIDKWLDRRKAAGRAPATAKPAKYGMWRYGWQRWQAMWEDLSERHQQVRADYKKAVNEARAAGRPLPPKPTMKETLTGWQWQIDQLGQEPDMVTGTTGPAAPSEPPATPPKASPAIPGDLAAAPTPPAVSAPAAPPGNCGTTATPAAPAKENLMASTAQSGEVTGIPSAVHYLNRMAAAHQQHANNEDLVSSLANLKVGEGDLGKIRAGMVASSEAAEMYTRAAKVLDDSNQGVKAGYASAPDAADKRAHIGG